MLPQICHRLLGGYRLRSHHRANGYRRVRWSWGGADARDLELATLC
jgi:hypothetical protein